MKMLLAVAVCLILSGCGGFDDVDAARDAQSGYGGSTSSPTVPSTPDNPNTQSLWEYSQTGSSKLAQIKSTNTIPTANRFNDAIMLVEFQNFTNSAGVISENLRISVLFAPTTCASSCNMRYKKNGSLGGVYPVRETVAGVFTNASFSSRDLVSITKAIKSSGKASLSVPLVGIPDAEFFFDFSGYDPRLM